MTKTPHLSSLWWIRSPEHPSIALQKEEMAAFINLEDSPMFRKQMYSMEHTADELKDRCQKLQKGCKRFVASLNEAYEGDLVFADYLEAFGAGQDDPISVSIGGPVMSRFTTAFREIGTYKELLRSQVEHMLSDRLMQFMSTDMQNVKECRRRFDKASQGYDQAREKFMSLKKGTRSEVVFELEEELHNSKSEFEKCRFNLVTALANVDAKKKYEFLESISATMDAHMRYFKQGYELLSQMEPFVHQVLTYAQQSKEMANAEQDKLVKRIQEYRTQAELASLRSLSNTEASTSGDGIHIVGVNSYKNIEAIMQSTANGEVKTIKQGYLLKLSSSLRGDWKRRFFVLDSYGTLYYYRTKWNSKPSKQPDEDDIGCHTVDLRTSTIKIDAEQSDLRFCFRIISPSKTLTLQAETAMDRREWVDKITGVIASLINSPFVNQGSSGRIYIEGKSFPKAIGYESSVEDTSEGHDNVAIELRGIPGNDICAECGAPEPDWASLNLGILICIECSGVHRNLGVHISKVRSLTLDVKVWEPTMLDLFRALGNSYCNSVWEGLILLQEGSETGLLSKKPGPRDTFVKKEMYIHLKYAEKMLIVKEPPQSDLPPPVLRAWKAVKTDNVQATYHLIVASDVNANTKYEEVSSDVIHLEDNPNSNDIAFCTKFKDSSELDSCMQGCTLLHLACHVGDPVMMELLLQFGADIDRQDYHGRTPLHHCILKKNNALAKYLLKRGARTSVRDGGGLTAIERAMELGSITDEELFLLLTRND